MLKSNLCIIALLLSGCGTTEPVIKVVTQIVKVPVPISCTEEVPVTPDYCFDKLSTDSDIYTKTQCLLSDRLLRVGQEELLVTKLNACKK